MLLLQPDDTDTDKRTFVKKILKKEEREKIKNVKLNI